MTYLKVKHIFDAAIEIELRYGFFALIIMLSEL
jgi:hypothetical protein